MKAPLILASASPRRRDLLASLGVPCEVLPADVVEPEVTSLPPRELVVASALLKARALAAKHPARLILGADTVVARSKEARSVLGKPRDAAAAREMLAALSGRSHEVLTGVALVRSAGAGARLEEASVVGVTRVRFAELSASFIERYVATGEPLDKAGSYGAQGFMGSHVTGIEGSWTNVVGLPLEQLPALFAELQEDLVDWQDW